MSLPALNKTSAVLREAMIHAAWAQWAAVEHWPAGSAAGSIVDPEALVLGSLWLEPTEPRFWRLLKTWARGGARWLSVQRIKNLAPDYPGQVQKRLGDFAWECAHAGKDARWRTLARSPQARVREGGRDLAASPQLKSPGALLLRLRVGLGVGVKADVLAYLLGSTDSKRTIGETTVATGYYRRAVQRGIDELVAAGFLMALPTTPASYRAPQAAWAPLLGLNADPSVWWHWHQLYAFGAALDAVAVESAGDSLYIQSSQARDVMEQHRSAFDLNGVAITDPKAATGEAYLSVLAEDVAELARRVRKNFV